MSKINGTAVNSRVFAFPFIVSTQGCKLNGTAVNSFTLKQFTTARCNQKGSIIIFQYCAGRSVLVVEETGVPGENHRPWTSNW
jgi:hypothetical protein